MATLLEQKCPCCGGAVEFDIGVQKLKCPYCDTEFDIQPTQQSEQPTEAYTDPINWDSQNSQWDDGETDGISVYSCNSCGGEIIADDTTGASNCPYCGNPVVVKGQFSGAAKPDLVIPFKIDKKAAKEALKKHLADKKFVPKGFFTDNHIDEIKGVYVPYWLYSGEAVLDVKYDAQNVRMWSDSQYNYTETSHFDVFRSGKVSFAHVPVDGSTKMPDDLMESLEPFNILQAVPFNTAYLAGYMADKYDVDADAGKPRANERIQRSSEEVLSRTVTGYSHFSPEDIKMNIANGTYKYALYPVWILNTSWNGNTYTFAMNGQSGKFIGNIPTDKKAVRKTGSLIGLGIGAVLYGLLWLFELLF